MSVNVSTSLLCVSIPGPSFADVEEQLERATGCAQVAEIRLDLLEGGRQGFDLDAVAALVAKATMPLLLTLRSVRHGGNYAGTIAEQCRLLNSLATLDLPPDYLDVEADLPHDFLKWIHQHSVSIILSYHDPHTVPTDEELSDVWNKLHKYPSTYYKVAAYAATVTDVYRLYRSAPTGSKTPQMTVPMGTVGQFYRVLAPMFGEKLVYASLSDVAAVAPGQLDAVTMRDIYGYAHVNLETAWYALLGNSVEQSISHIVHNAFYREFGFDAVYVKIPIGVKEDLGKALEALVALGSSGFSVTMPYKEAIIPYLHSLDRAAEAIGAVNTIVRTPDCHLVGYNTDGPAALDALMSHRNLVGKRLVVIGAGGAARAIAYTAVQLGIKVTVVNRTEERAQNLAAAYGCQWASLDAMADVVKDNYEAIVNTTPLRESSPVLPEHILPHALVMDIVNKPAWTHFLRTAQGRGCQTVFGYEMFIRQAIAQALLWFPKADITRTCTLVRDVTLSVLKPDQ